MTPENIAWVFIIAIAGHVLLKLSGV